MIFALRNGASASLRVLWALAAPAFVAATVVVLIDWLPLATAGINLTSLAKGLIAVPVGLAFAFGASHRRFLVTLLAGVMCLLLIAFTWSGYAPNDPAVESALISLLALSFWLTLPYVLPRKLRLREPPDIVELLHALGSVSRALPSRTDLAGFLRLWARTIRWSARVVLLLGFLATVVLAVLLVAALAAGMDARVLFRLGMLVADGAVGAVAMWFLAQRLFGTSAALPSSLLWLFCSMRLEVSGYAGSDFLPTWAVPAVAAVLLRARDRGVLRGPSLALVLGVVVLGLAWFWPLLALTVAFATTLLLWGAGYARDARWTLAAFFAWVLFACTAIPNQNVSRIFADSSLRDPAHAAAACASGCDGGLPWEYFYPSPFGWVYSGLLIRLYTATVHWGNYQTFAISPGWAQLALALCGAWIVWRRGRRGLLLIWGLGVAIGVVLALPSHYLGLGLPSLARLVVSVAPNFTFAAQSSLLGAVFVVLLGGVAVSSLAFPGNKLRLVPAVLLVVLIGADVASPPVFGHPASVLARSSAWMPVERGSRARIAFYPFLTPDYGPEYDELSALARRENFEFVNQDGDENALGDLTDPNVQTQLRARGVRYVVVSLADYARRREILDEAHVLLPLDQEGTASAWLAPEPADLLRLTVIRAEGDGSLLLSP